MQKHTLELGPEISYIEYKEPGYMKEKGWMYGIVGSYSYHSKIMLRAEGRFSYGWVDYDGKTVSGTPVGVDDIDDYIFEVRGLIGYDFTNNICYFSPYTGIGYRYLNDDLSEHVGGYERESNYIYSPIGAKFIIDLKDGWSIGAQAEYDIFWWGKQISHFSDIDPGLNDVKNRQTQGYGSRGSIEIQKKFKTVTFALEPFIRYWNIKESSHEYLTWHGRKISKVWEPENQSTEYGINLLVRF